MQSRGVTSFYQRNRLSFLFCYAKRVIFTASAKMSKYFVCFCVYLFPHVAENYPGTTTDHNYEKQLLECIKCMIYTCMQFVGEYVHNCACSYVRLICTSMYTSVGLASCVLQPNKYRMFYSFIIPLSTVVHNFAQMTLKFNCRYFCFIVLIYSCDVDMQISSLFSVVNVVHEVFVTTT